MRIYPTKTGKYVTCPVCGKVTYLFPSKIKQGRKEYCSKKCWYEYMPIRLKLDKKYKQGILNGLKASAIKRKQILQSDEFKKAQSKRFKQYSKEGRFPKRFGKDNNLWKGGIASLQNIIRQTPEYKEWRYQVYKRDNYICRHCGTNKDLHAHHIKTFSQYPDLRYDIDNGITVCRSCHSKIHGRYLPDISKANKKVKV